MVEAIVLSRLTIRPGDVVVVTTPQRLTDGGAQKIGKDVREGVKKNTGHDVTVFVVEGDWTIESMPEDEMKRLGWIRDPDFNDR